MVRDSTQPSSGLTHLSVNYLYYRDCYCCCSCRAYLVVMLDAASSCFHGLLILSIVYALFVVVACVVVC